jgi:hypothetical protein
MMASFSRRRQASREVSRVLRLLAHDSEEIGPAVLDGRCAGDQEIRGGSTLSNAGLVCPPASPLGGFAAEGFHFALDALGQFVLGGLQVVFELQVQPHLGGCSE